jgi:hypothetical protein
MVLSLALAGFAEDKLWFEVQHRAEGDEKASIWCGWVTPDDYKKIVSGETPRAFIRIHQGFLNMQNGKKQLLQNDFYVGELVFRVADIQSLVALDAAACEAITGKQQGQPEKPADAPIVP